MSTELDTISDAVKSTSNHLLINASAGSGKTYSLVHIVEKLLNPNDTLTLAFNKKASDELKARMPNNPNVSTHHSLGMKLVRENMQGKMQDVEKSEQWKNVNTIKKLFGNPKEPKDKALMYMSLGVCNKVNEYLRYSAILKPSMADIETALQDSNVVNPKYLNRFKDIEALQDTCLAFYNASIGNKNPWGALECTYSDMVFYPVYYGWNVPKYKYLLIDEVQDYSPLFLKVVESFLKNGTRIIAVGDDYQAIYGWRGANKAIAKLSELLERY